MIRKLRPVRSFAFSRSCAKRSISPAKSPPRTECFDIFSPPPGDSEVISQLERLNSNETKIAPRSVWIAVNGSDLSAPMFMVSSKMNGSEPHFDAESIATHNTSWDLEKVDVQADPTAELGKADTDGRLLSDKYAHLLHRGSGD